MNSPVRKPNDLVASTADESFAATAIKGRIVVSQTAVQLLAELERIPVESKQSRRWLVPGIAAVVVAVIVLGYMVGLANGALVYLVGIPVLAVVMAVLSGWTFDQERYNVALKLTELLACDVAPDALIDFEFVLPGGSSAVVTSIIDPANLVSAEKKGAWDVDNYQQCWFMMSGTFLDGTAFRFELVERLSDRSRMNVSGKLKTKRKHKQQATVRLRPSNLKQKYLRKAFNDGESKLKIAPLLSVRRTLRKGTTVLVVGVTDEPWSEGTPERPHGPPRFIPSLGSLLLAAYQPIRRARGTSAKKRSG